MEKMKNPKYKLYNRLHKKLVVLYKYKKIKTIWDRARQDYLEDTLIELGTGIHKNLDKASMFESWLDEKILKAGKGSIVYFNKADLKDRGWTPKLMTNFLPEPNRVIDLGRGRKAYYYELSMLLNIEESEDFLMMKSKKKILKKQSEKGSLSHFNLI